MGERIAYKANGKGTEGYLAKPTAPGPAVIVIQEWWGLVPQIEGVADGSRPRASSPSPPICSMAPRRRRPTRRANS